MKTKDDRSGKVVQGNCQNQAYTLLQVNRSQNQSIGLDQCILFGLRSDYVLLDDVIKLFFLKDRKKQKTAVFKGSKRLLA